MLINNGNQDFNHKECQDCNQCCLFEQCNVFWKPWLNGIMDCLHLWLWMLIMPCLPHSALSTCTSSFFFKQLLTVVTDSTFICWLIHLSLYSSDFFHTVYSIVCILKVLKSIICGDPRMLKWWQRSKWTLYFGSSYEVKPVLKLPILLSQVVCHQDSRWVSYLGWVNNFK